MLPTLQILKPQNILEIGSYIDFLHVYKTEDWQAITSIDPNIAHLFFATNITIADAFLSSPYPEFPDVPAQSPLENMIFLIDGDHSFWRYPC